MIKILPFTVKLIIFDVRFKRFVAILSFVKTTFCPGIIISGK